MSSNNKMLRSKGVGISEGVAVSRKAPLCKGGWQPKADWGIVKATVQLIFMAAP